MNVRSLIPLGLLLLVAFALTFFALRDEGGGTAAPFPEPYGPGEVQVASHERGVQVIDMRSKVMGTRFVVEVAAPDEATGREACRAAYRRIHELECALSTWKEESLLSRLNRAPPGEWFATDPDTFHLLLETRAACERTDGAFDPTVGPLVRLWRQAARSGRPPADSEIARARTFIGFEPHVALRSGLSREVRLEAAGVSLDLGGIAKGYAADAAAWIALTYGATACRVNAGGDHVALGAPPWAPHGFPVVVRDPEGEETDGLDGFAFPLLDRGVATSGNYERFTEIDGKKYSHIIDPRTGRPVENPVVQVTVIARDGTSADALGTALAVLGVAEGLRLAEGAPDIEAMFITRESSGLVFHRTSGFPGGTR